MYNSQTTRNLIAIVCLAFVATGCVKRTISVSSTPQGALVWLNDREVGRTPITIDFAYYGEYDIRLELQGHDPIMTSRWVKTPYWDAPIIDLATELVAPNSHAALQWHFELVKTSFDPIALVNRANKFKERQGVEQ